MRRHITITTVVALLMLVTTKSFAERLEVGLALGPSWIHGDDFDDFSRGEGAIGQLGLDLRSEVGSVKGFKFVPTLGYRFSRNEGKVADFVDTDIYMHDFLLGLRVRKGVLSWMAIFAEPKVGLQMASFDGEPGYDGDLRYVDRSVTWTTGLMLGLEAYISRAWLRSRGVNRFCFGGELAGGYLRHGALTVDPELENKDKDAIDSVTIGDWGELNTSAWVVQIAVSFYFF